MTKVVQLTFMLTMTLLTMTTSEIGGPSDFINSPLTVLNMIGLLKSSLDF